MNGDVVHPIDPFFEDLTRTDSNRFTLEKPLDVKTYFVNEDGSESEQDLKAKAFIIPTTQEINEDIDGRDNEDKLSSMFGGGVSRKALQGIYIFRNQRLIDFANANAWKGIVKDTMTTIPGRWEVHLPPHNPTDLQNIDFAVDKTKTDIRIGKKTLENLRTHWAGKSYRWHPLDPKAATVTGRLKNRTNRGKKAPFELICDNCSTIGHHQEACPNAQTSTSNTQRVKSNNKTGKSQQPKTKNIVQITSVGAIPQQINLPNTGNIDYKLVKSGDLISLDGNLLMLNKNHGKFTEFVNWVSNING